MGDRAVIHFTDGQKIGPAVYVHWSGEDVPAILGETRRIMEDRLGDVGYTTARCIGVCHDRIEGNLSLGTWSAPSEAEIRHADYTHGDAGVFLVNCSGDTWTVECWGGYGLDGEGDYDSDGSNPQRFNLDPSGEFQKAA